MIDVNIPNERSLGLDGSGITHAEMWARTISYYKRPVSNTRPTARVSIGHIVEYIRGDYYRLETEQLRAITDPKERRKFKATHFDSVTFCGLFAERKDDQLLCPTDFLCLDFDHVGDRLTEVRRQLIDDPEFETVLLFRSPSGDGLKWVVKIDLNQCDYATWYKAILNYVCTTYQVKADDQCRNLSRACFLCYDPEVYVNPSFFPSEYKNNSYYAER